MLSCRDREYAIGEGSILLFNPGDSHACVQSDGGTFDYRGFNISKEIMLDLAEEVTRKRELPGFSKNVIYEEEAACHLRTLHEMVMKGTGEFGKEETLLFLLSYLIQNYGQSLRLLYGRACTDIWRLPREHTTLLPAVKTSVYIYMVPVTTIVTSVLVLKEPVTWVSAVGTVLAVAGLFLSEYNGKGSGKDE